MTPLTPSTQLVTVLPITEGARWLTLNKKKYPVRRTSEVVLGASGQEDDTMEFLVDESFPVALLEAWAEVARMYLAENKGETARDFFKPLADAAKLKKPKTVAEWTDALLAKKRFGRLGE